MATKAEWKEARAALDAIERERAGLLAPTFERFKAATAALEEIEDELGEPRLCECGEPVFEDEPCHYGGDVLLCVQCAPTYADMLQTPGAFLGSDMESMTPEQAQAAVDAHLAAGGSLTDKMVSA